jgi:hypothetical protein
MRKWSRANLNKYYEVIEGNRTLRGEASAELTNFFVEKNIKSLNFKDIISLRDRIL